MSILVGWSTLLYSPQVKVYLRKVQLLKNSSKAPTLPTRSSSTLEIVSDNQANTQIWLEFSSRSKK
jgi:hypothetical protein